MAGDLRSLAPIAIVAALAACSAPEPKRVAPPADVAWLAILELGDEGALEGASTLIPWTDGSALPVFARDASEQVVLVGFRGGELDALASLAGRPGGFDGRLRLATGCEQALPTPAWLATWAKDGPITEGDPSTAPHLTVAGLEDACPDRSADELAIDLRCPSTRCPATSSKLARCAITIDLSSCDYGTLKATFDAAGRACVEPENGVVTCTAREDRSASAGPYACTGPRACELDVNVTPKDAAPPYHREHQLFPVTPWLPQSVSAPGAVGNVFQEALGSGWAHDLVVLDDRVVVVAPPDATTPTLLCAIEHHSVPTRVFILDLELSMARTSTAPSCLQRLVRDPLGPGLLGTYVEGDPLAWRVGRFDADGRLVASAPTNVPWDWWTVLDLVIVGDRLVVLSTQTGGGSRLEIHDLATLAEEKTVTIARELITSDLVPLEGHRVLLVSEDTRQLAELDLDTEVIAERRRFPDDLDRRAWIYGAWRDARTARLFVGARGSQAAYLVGAEDHTFTGVALFGADTAATGFQPWAEGGLVLVGGYRSGDWRATLTLLDPARPRFVAPTWVLGHGPIGRMRAGPGGRVWVILPWAGTVAVVGPS